MGRKRKGEVVES